MHKTTTLIYLYYHTSTLSPTKYQNANVFKFKKNGNKGPPNSLEETLKNLGIVYTTLMDEKTLYENLKISFNIWKYILDAL